MEYIRECLDTGRPFEEGKCGMSSMVRGNSSPHRCFYTHLLNEQAETMVRFFEYLPAPLFPTANVLTSIESGVTEITKRHFLASLPPVNFRVSIIFFFFHLLLF